MADAFELNTKTCPNCNTSLPLSTTRCFNCKYDFVERRIIRNTLKCPNCGLDVDKNQKFCTVCGAKLDFKQCIHCGAYFDARLAKCNVCNKEQVTEKIINSEDLAGELLTSEMSLDMKMEYLLNLGRIRLFMFIELLLLVALTFMILFIPFLSPNIILLGNISESKFLNGIDFFKCVFGKEDLNDYLINQEGILFFNNTLLAKPIFIIIYSLLFIGIALNFARVICGFAFKKPNRGIMITLYMLVLAIFTLFGIITSFTNAFKDYDCLATYLFILVFIYWILTMYIFNKETKNFYEHFDD